MGMKISEIIMNKYKLRMPPTVYYDLLADVVEAEDEQEPKTGHWISRPHIYGVAFCSECGFELKINNTNYCPNCGAEMSEVKE